MDNKEIHDVLDNMLGTPKTRGFLNHLIRAYLPINNTEKVITKPKGDFTCVLSREPLISTQELLEGIRTEGFEKDFMNHIKTIFDDSVNVEHPITKLIGDKKLGVVGKDTTTFMSYNSFMAFYGWVIDKSLKGDKHINWLLHNINRDNKSTLQYKIKNVKRAEPKTRAATFSLGDAANDMLLKLKTKMEKDEN